MLEEKYVCHSMPNNAPKWLHTPTPYVPRGTPNIHRRTMWKSLSSLKWVKSYLTLHTIIHKLYNYKSCHTLTHLVPYMAPRKLWILLEASFWETGQQHLLARTCRTGYWRHADLTRPIRLPIRNYLKKNMFCACAWSPYGARLRTQGCFWVSGARCPWW